jgi:CCR4-NOT transcription complex subunit 2
MFGQPGNGEMLLGRGFDSSVAHAFGNESSSSTNNTGNNSTNNGAPGNIGSSAFDLNDFPSLGGGSPATGGENNSLTAALRQQQQLMAQQQIMQSQSSGNKVSQSTNLYRLAMGNAAPTNANFKIATEDFPALPGAPPLGSGGTNSGSGLLDGVENHRELTGSSNQSSSFVTSAPSSRTTNGNENGIFGGSEFDGFTNQPDATSLLGGGLGNLVAQSIQRPNAPQPNGVAGANSNVPNGGSSLSGDFGLLGLLAVIRMTDADRNALALGSDLTSLGLNLSSSEQLYSTFASPWSESPTSREPQYQVR